MNKQTYFELPKEEQMFLHQYDKAYLQGLKALEQMDFSRRLWAKDAGLWKNDPQHQKIIKNSLGWLFVVDNILENLDELLKFSDEVKKDGIQHILLLGMGGSSLAPEFFRLSLPAKTGFPKLHVLDSTDPDWISEIETSLDLDKTLFIFASKSGTTIEPLSFFNYFYDRVKEKGNQFIAITDKGTFLENLAKEKGFRKIFLNPEDIGGRFSALSYFGMVPAALSGMNVGKILESAKKMLLLCGDNVALEENPGVRLGLFLGELSKFFLDKVTLVLPKELEAFGLWIEQLIAESSGKEGKGIVPITGESLTANKNYREDRMFVTIHYKNKEEEGESKNFLKNIEKKFPLLKIFLNQPEDLGGELVRWEIATATACALLGVNAFDQPDVQSAKDVTGTILKELESNGSLPSLASHYEDEFFKVTFSDVCLKNKKLNQENFSRALKDFLAQINSNDYIGLLAYLPFKLSLNDELQDLRNSLRDQTKAATLFGYGPRYLHSTGQLHKGGANTGVFLILTQSAKSDLQLPGKKYSFKALEMAQSLGDFQALNRKGRRAIYIHLKQDALVSIQKLKGLVKSL